MPTTYGLGDWVTVGVGQEAAYNTTWASPTAGLRVKPCAPSELGPTLIETEHAIGHLMNVDTEIGSGALDWAMTLEGAVPTISTAFGLLLYSMFDELGGIPANIYTIGVSDPLSLRLAYQDQVDGATKSWRLCGAKPKSLKITASPNDFLRFSADMIGTFPQRNNTDALSLQFPSTAYYTFANCGVEIGGAATVFTSWECTIDGGLCDSDEDSHVLGSQHRARLVNGTRKVEATITRVFESTNGSAKWADKIGTSTDILLKASSGTTALNIDMPKARIIDWKIEGIGKTGLSKEVWTVRAFVNAIATSDAEFFVQYDQT